uniref:Transcriptional regulator n=1 Tax=Syphacia muris TaxID=451379 RepID=A0A0N5ANZ8_9BILA
MKQAELASRAPAQTLINFASDHIEPFSNVFQLIAADLKASKLSHLAQF